MKINKYIFTVCIIFSGTAKGEWANRFYKKISPFALRHAESTNHLYFIKKDVPMFSQLLLSWNAYRPEKGHFTFFVKARNAHTQKWGSWHKMVEWGSDSQRSFTSRSDGFTKYVHVRLETESLQLGDAFYVKVVGAKGAELSKVKNLIVTTINMNEFQPESSAMLAKGLSSVFIENVPKISQLSTDHAEKKRICSPVSCSMLGEHITKTRVDAAKFAHSSYDAGLDSYGSWPFNVAHLFEHCKSNVICSNTRLNSFKDIHGYLKKKTPVVVSVRGTLGNPARSYPHGHLLAVVGYDSASKEVICHDPAKEGHANVEHRYALADFMKSWEASRRLSYLVELS